MASVDVEHQSVDLFADAADLPLKGVEIDTAWLWIDTTWLGIRGWGGSIWRQLQGRWRSRRRCRIIGLMISTIVVDAFWWCYGGFYSGSSTTLRIRRNLGQIGARDEICLHQSVPTDGREGDNGEVIGERTPLGRYGRHGRRKSRWLCYVGLT